MGSIFSTTDLIYSFLKVRLKLIKARPFFHLIVDNPKGCLWNVDCSPYNGRIALEDDYHKDKKDTPANTLVQQNCLESLAEVFNQFFITKPVHSMKHFVQYRITSRCFCNEYKICIRWIAHWKPMVSTLGFQIIWNTDKSLACSGFLCCWELALTC